VLLEDGFFLPHGELQVRSQSTELDLAPGQSVEVFFEMEIISAYDWGAQVVGSGPLCEELAGKTVLSKIDVSDGQISVEGFPEFSTWMQWEMPGDPPKITQIFSAVVTAGPDYDEAPFTVTAHFRMLDLPVAGSYAPDPEDSDAFWAGIPAASGLLDLAVGFNGAAAVGDGQSWSTSDPGPGAMQTFPYGCCIRTDPDPGVDCWTPGADGCYFPVDNVCADYSVQPPQECLGETTTFVYEDCPLTCAVGEFFDGVGCVSLCPEGLYQASTGPSDVCLPPGCPERVEWKVPQAVFGVQPVRTEFPINQAGSRWAKSEVSMCRDPFRPRFAGSDGQLIESAGGFFGTCAGRNINFVTAPEAYRPILEYAGEIPADRTCEYEITTEWVNDPESPDGPAVDSPDTAQMVVRDHQGPAAAGRVEFRQFKGKGLSSGVRESSRPSVNISVQDDDGSAVSRLDFCVLPSGLDVSLTYSNPVAGQPAYQGIKPIHGGAVTLIPQLEPDSTAFLGRRIQEYVESVPGGTCQPLFEAKLEEIEARLEAGYIDGLSCADLPRYWKNQYCTRSLGRDGVFDAGEKSELALAVRKQLLDLGPCLSSRSDSGDQPMKMIRVGNLIGEDRIGLVKLDSDGEVERRDDSCAQVIRQIVEDQGMESCQEGVVQYFRMSCDRAAVDSGADRAVFVEQLSFFTINPRRMHIFYGDNKVDVEPMSRQRWRRGEGYPVSVLW